MHESTWGVLGTGRTDAAGAFRMAYTRPGTYVLGVDPPATSPLGNLRRPGVVVTSGGETPVGTLTLPAR